MSKPMSWAVTFSERRKPRSKVGSVSQSLGEFTATSSEKFSSSRHTKSNSVASTRRSRLTPSLSWDTGSSIAADHVRSMAVPTCALMVTIGTLEGPCPGMRLFEML